MSKNCPDCGVAPGGVHDYGCDIERCIQCGGQLISCDCETEAHPPPAKDRDRWTGEFPGRADARRLGLFCKEQKIYNGHGPWVPCEESDPEATPDLNRLAAECTWNPKTRQWEKR